MKINGEPFDPNRKYFTVMQHAHVSGCDNLVPLMEWVKANESSVSAELLLLLRLSIFSCLRSRCTMSFISRRKSPSWNISARSFFCNTPSFLARNSTSLIDRDNLFHSLVRSMTRDELEAHIKKLYGDDRIVGIMVDNIMALGKNGVIERNDFLSTVFELTGFEEMDTNKEYAFLSDIFLLTPIVDSYRWKKRQNISRMN